MVNRAQSSFSKKSLLTTTTTGIKNPKQQEEQYPAGNEYLPDNYEF